MSNAFDTATDANAPLPFAGASATMSPPAAQPTPKRSLDDMTGNDAQYDAITKADTDLTQRKIGAEAGIQGMQQRQDAAYAARQERMLAAEGATMEDLKPWNADKELNDRKTNLWEQFGSPGFIVAMLASTFSGTPMNSALNAGAAAMNAINQGDMDKYNKAFDAFKENSTLTLKRLDIEEKAFNQIGDLRTRNMEQWRAQATALATRFNDQRMLIMLQNGMDPQVMEAQAGLAKAKVDLAAAHDLLLQNHVRMGMLQDDPDYKSGDPKKMLDAIHNVDDAMRNEDPTKLSADQYFNWMWHKEHPHGGSADYAKDFADYKRNQRAGAGGDPVALMQQIEASDAGAPSDESTEDMITRQNGIRANYYAAKNPIGAERNVISREAEEGRNRRAELSATTKLEVNKLSTEARKEISAAQLEEKYDLASMSDKTRREIAGMNNDARMELQKFLEGGRNARSTQKTTASSMGGSPSAEKGRRYAAWDKTHPDATEDEKNAAHDKIAEEVGQANAPAVTGNKALDAKSHIGQYDDALKLIDGIDKTLNRYAGSAGLAGRATRLSERVGNVLGSNQTDRTQMMRDISQLQLMGPRLLLDQKTGRPLSAEAAHVSDIIAGLSLGDTTANTLRAMKELKQRLQTIRDRDKSALPGGAPPPADDAPAVEDRPWENDPIQK